MQDVSSDVAQARSIGYASIVAKRDAHEVWDRLSEVMKCIRGVAAETYGELEVGTAQAKLLRHIGRESKISQADLARATDTAPTLTGRALEPLVERGWIRRKRSEEDRRQYVLELTASGQRIRDRIEEKRLGIIDRLSTVLDDKDVADMDRIAAKVLTTFGGAPKES